MITVKQQVNWLIKDMFIRHVLYENQQVTIFAIIMLYYQILRFIPIARLLVP
jgi:hypothetical protein